MGTDAAGWWSLVSLFGSIYFLDLVHLSVFKIKTEMFREQGSRPVARDYGKDLLIWVRWAKISKTVGCTSAVYILTLRRQQSSRK